MRAKPKPEPKPEPEPEPELGIGNGLPSLEAAFEQERVRDSSQSRVRPRRRQPDQQSITRSLAIHSNSTYNG